jgi:hypothetical protein
MGVVLRRVPELSGGGCASGRTCDATPHVEVGRQFRLAEDMVVGRERGDGR